LHGAKVIRARGWKIGKGVTWVFFGPRETRKKKRGGISGNVKWGGWGSSAERGGAAETRRGGFGP